MASSSLAAPVEPKYGGTLYTLRPDEKEAQFCGVFLYAKLVQLAFPKGAELNVPTNELAGSGETTSPEFRTAR